MIALAIIILCMGVCFAFLTPFITLKIIDIKYKQLSKNEKEQKFKNISNILLYGLIIFTLISIISIKVIS